MINIKGKGIQKNEMKQFFLMTVGYSQTGKSTFIEKVLDKIPGIFVRVRSDDIRNFLNANYSVFKDDNTVKSKVYWPKEDTVKKIQGTLVESMLKEGASIALDSCNMVLKKRSENLRTVKNINPDIKTIIVRVKIPESKIYENLKKADQEYISRGEKPAWVDLYEKVQKGRFEEPSPEEADYFIIYNWDNLDEVINKIKMVIIA